MQHNPLILIIDDDASARDTLEALLYPDDYEVKLVASGAEALAYLDSYTPDTILLDVMMPEMDGFELCRRIKANKRWRHVPIILVTALDTKENVVHGLEAGADEFLPKPVNGIELRARVRSMLRIKKQYDEVTAMLQLREDLAHMIVHDIRNPLTTIVGFSEFLLTRKDMPEKYRPDVKAIVRQGQILQAFTHDLLMLAKMEQNQLMLNWSLVEVNRLVTEVKEILQPIAQSKEIELVMNGSQSEPLVACLDATLFQRVVDNLVSNALKFSPVGSVVKLQLEDVAPQAACPSARKIRFKVIDEGPGVAPEDRERIFDKFEIVNLKRQGITQVGLGLAFCKLVVEAHGGCIGVEANLPEGSVFTVEI